MAVLLQKEGGKEAVEKLFSEPLNPQQLMEEGYRVEFASCGLMTAAVGTKEGPVYLHTNYKVSREAFLLAKSWLEKGKKTYLVHGFGLGYHVAELLCQTKDAVVEVYESNGKILKLACAFAPIAGILANERLRLVYDPTGMVWEGRTGKLSPEEKLCIHVPSMRADLRETYMAEEKKESKEEAGA